MPKSLPVTNIVRDVFSGAKYEGEPASRERTDTMQILGAPAPLSTAAADTLATRFTGTITAPTNGEYRFLMRGTGQFKLYLDDRLIVNSWATAWPHTAHNSIQLTAGRTYRLRMDVLWTKSSWCTMAWSPLGASPRT